MARFRCTTSPLPYPAMAGEALSGYVSPFGAGLRRTPGCSCPRCNPDRIECVRQVRYYPTRRRRPCN